MNRLCPEYIQLYPTVRCNQSCVFCFNKSLPVVPDLEYEQGLWLLYVLKRNGIREIDIMGGEPFLLQWMPDFIYKALQSGFAVNVSTNGSCPDALDMLKGAASGQLTIGVSLEGSSISTHNSLTQSAHFDAALGSIKKLIAYDLDPLVKTVVNKSTQDDLQDIVDLLKSLGVRRYYLIHMDLLSNEQALFEEALSYPEFLKCYDRLCQQNPDMAIHKVNASCFDQQALPAQTRCAGGNRKLLVMPDGEVYPCNLLATADDFRLGNIFTDPFQDIWGNQILSYFRTYAGNLCSLENCLHRSNCTGGCPAHGLFHYNDPDKTDIRCNQL